MKLAYQLIAVCTLLVGGGVIYGWFTSNANIIQVHESFVPMQFNTALCFVLLSLSLFCAIKRISVTALTLAGLTSLVGMLTLLQYLLDIDLGIDQLLMDHYITTETSHPGRMAPNTALCFLIAGAAIVSFRQKRLPDLTSVLIAILMALSLTAFFGYVFNINTAYGWQGLTRMALHTSICFLLVGSALVLLNIQVQEDRAQRSRSVNVILFTSITIFILSLWLALDSWQAALVIDNNIRHSRINLPLMVLISGFAFLVMLGYSVRLRHKDRKIRLQLQKSQEQLKQIIGIDSLTGLSNRYAFENSIDQQLRQAQRINSGIALLLLDLDNFKNINDTLGHIAGDKLLIEVSTRLQDLTRDSELLCRLGGDEFVILIQFQEDIRSLRFLAERILSEMARPFNVDKNLIEVSASIGIASYPQNAKGAEQLLKCADVAMYRSKNAGKNQVHFYNKEMHTKIYEYVEMEKDLANAIQEEQFELYYQPQMDTATGAVIGAEALIRWHHPKKGIVSPAVFIPIAESCGVIEPLTRWVIAKACKQISNWRQKHVGMTLRSVSINLSAKNLSDKSLCAFIEQQLHEYNLPASALEIELTESAVMQEDEDSNSVLNEIFNIGIPMALDDFGTGYSSLKQLHDYPFTTLKIDRSFLKVIQNSVMQALFVKSITAFAQTLGLHTVAEGVETEFQLKLCRSIGINRIQGYYYSKPLQVQAFEASYLALPVPEKKSM